MAFVQVRSLDGSSDPFEYRKMTNSEPVTLGEALVMSSGRLTKCGATSVPQYIALASADAGTDVEIPVVMVKEGREFETTSTATVAATLIGSKVTLHTDGLTVTATTTSGVFEITGTDGATTNSTVRGMFRR